MPINPAGRGLAVVIERAGALMVIVRLAVAVLAGNSESVTVTVKVVGPTNGPVGVPVIALPTKFKPAGRLPGVTDQL